MGQSIDQIVCLRWWAVGIQSDTSFCCSTKLPTLISSLQSIPPCHCWSWWKTLRLWCFVAAHFGGNILGWMAFFRSWPAPGSADISWCQCGHSAFLSVRWTWPSRQRRWPGAKTINAFRACLGAQLTICAQKCRNFVLFSTVSLRFVLSRFCVFLYSLGPWCFDDFILMDTSPCSRNVLFASTSFNPAAFAITNNLDVSYCIVPPGRHVLLDFAPYQINSRAPEDCSFLWFGPEVDIVLVSISKMNQENKRVSVITHQYCFTGVWDFQCQWNMLFHNHAWKDIHPEGLGTIACYLC